MKSLFAFLFNAPTHALAEEQERQAKKPESDARKESESTCWRN